MRILVAEDDPVSGEVLRHSLASLGHEVTVTADGQQALEAFQKSPAEVVVTDLMMPVMDGPELCRRIRQLGCRHYVYVVFLTMLDRKARYLEAMDAGADDFLNKPLDREQLTARLRVAKRILSMHQELNDLRGALRFCPGCKCYCDSSETWRPLEELLEPALNAEFKPRICPECEARLARTAVD